MIYNIPNKVARPDVRVLVAGTVVAVQIEQATILILVVVTADIQNRAGTVVVALEHIDANRTTGEEAPKFI